MSKRKPFDRKAVFKAPEKPGTKERKCMSCGTLFRSEGPGNRLCAYCRTRSNYAEEHRIAI